MIAASLLARAEAVLIDFDGPLAHVFSAYPAVRMAAELRTLAARAGIPVGGPPTSGDPLDVLRHCPPENALSLDAELTSRERHAGALARPTAGAGDLLRDLNARGVAVAVVTNNSEDGVRAHLVSRGLAGLVAAVHARVPGRPDLMKPSPHLLLAAVADLGVAAADALMIGDSVTDVEAARAAGVPCLGHANKPGKREALTAAGADAVVDDLRELLPDQA